MFSLSNAVNLISHCPLYMLQVQCIQESASSGKFLIATRVFREQRLHSLVVTRYLILGTRALYPQEYLSRREVYR